MRKGRIAMPLVTASVCVFVFTGCGGGSKNSTSNPATASTANAGAGSTGTTNGGASETEPQSGHQGGQLTAAALISHADAICRQFHDKRATLHAQTSQQLHEFGTKVASYEKTAVEELEKLTPPATLTSDWKAMVTGARTLSIYTPKIIGYVANNVNTRSAKEVYAAATKLRETVFAIAKRDGFEYCSQAI